MRQKKEEEKTEQKARQLFCLFRIFLENPQKVKFSIILVAMTFGTRKIGQNVANDVRAMSMCPAHLSIIIFLLNFQFPLLRQCQTDF